MSEAHEKISSWELYLKGFDLRGQSPKEALRCFEEALEIDEGFCDALFEVAIQYTRLEMEEKGREAFKKLLDIYSVEANVYSTRHVSSRIQAGNFEMKFGNFSKAKEYYKEAYLLSLKLNQSHLLNFTGLTASSYAFSCVKTGAISEAKKYYKIAFEQYNESYSKNNIESYVNFCKSYSNFLIEQDMEKEACLVMEKAKYILESERLDNSIDYADILLTLSDIYKRLEDSRFEECFRRAYVIYEVNGKDFPSNTD